MTYRLASGGSSELQAFPRRPSSLKTANTEPLQGCPSGVAWRDRVDPEQQVHLIAGAPRLLSHLERNQSNQREAS